MKIIDISRSLLSAEVYPGDPVPQLTSFASIARGDESNINALTMGLHSGTHVDAPLHFLDGGKDITQLPLSVFIGPCTVLTIDEPLITGAVVDRFFPYVCPKRVLLNTNGKGGFDSSGAQELSQRGIELIGIDTLSVSTKGDESEPHKAFLRKDIAILENITLENVPDGEYFLLALPLKIDGMEASPVRAILVDNYIFWSRPAT